MTATIRSFGVGFADRNIQAGMKLLEATIDRKTAPDNHDAASTVFVLDDVTSLREGERHAERLQCQPWRCPSRSAGCPSIRTASRRFHSALAGRFA
jgi:hypothetical protein